MADIRFARMAEVPGPASGCDWFGVLTVRLFGVGIACLVASVFLVGEASGNDWPNFRGPGYDGISTETGIRTKWSKPIPLVWQREIGSAFSSFACVGNRVYTCGTAGDQQVLYCLDADTGKPLWQTPIEKAFRDNYGDGTRATPTVNDGRVYILGGHGTLLCADAKTGKKLWTKEFKHAPYWGYAGSVLIEGDLAISIPGSGDGSLAAFDKKTGQERWECGDDPPGYATPYPFTFDGMRYVVGFTGTSVIIAEAKTGRLALRMPWKTDYQVNASSPIFSDGHLFISSGYRTGAGVFRLKKAESGLEADPVWRDTVLMNKFQSCVLRDGLLYGSDQKALVCADFLTGQERWRVPRIKHGTVLVAGKNLLVLTEGGQLQVGKIGGERFEPMTKADILTGRCWSVPVLHRGKLYARNLERVVCFDLTGE